MAQYAFITHVPPKDFKIRGTNTSLNNPNEGFIRFLGWIRILGL
jgi:hypothetical protein